MGDSNLAEFIDNHRREILAEWQRFAGTLLPAAQGMDSAALRDHANEILSAIVEDMNSNQTAAEAAEKSQGLRDAPRLASMGRIHAQLRIESGFDLSQVVAEYRALRASVLVLWGKMGADPAGMIRFNESIDEALSVAISRFTNLTDHYRDETIAILGHDLRNPLSGIIMGATLLVDSGELGEKTSTVAVRALSSARRMKRMIEDLLDLTRTRFGGPIPIQRVATDLEPICAQVVAELEGLHPTGGVRLTCEGNLKGDWDEDRVAQLLSNLVRNAIEHGSESAPIDVVAYSDDAEAVVAVHNFGAPIPKDALEKIFEPEVRIAPSDRKSQGLGLGLYVASQVAIAHRGRIDGASDEAGGTTFTVHLPRQAPQARRATRESTHFGRESARR